MFHLLLLQLPRSPHSVFYPWNFWIILSSLSTPSLPPSVHLLLSPMRRLEKNRVSTSTSMYFQYNALWRLLNFLLMCLCVTVCVSIYVFVFLHVSLCVFVSLHICAFQCLFVVYLFESLPVSVTLPVHPSVRLSACLSLCTSVCLSVCLFVHKFVYLHLYIIHVTKLWGVIWMMRHMIFYYNYAYSHAEWQMRAYDKCPSR